jgi:riboflavin kinase/FMN adenylyltransferase
LFEGDLYGLELAVRLHERLRDVRKFESVEALRAQLQEDLTRVQQILTGGR